MTFIEKHKIKCNVLKSNNSTQMLELLEDIVVFKKVHSWDLGRKIITLFIPSGTIIHTPIGHSTIYNKCRAEFAIVKSLYGNKQSIVNGGLGYGSRQLTYTKNEPVFPHRFDKGLNTCAGGIHFFFSRKDAKDY